ncbi:MAG: hypothetical protein WA047_00365 [Phenylobacterium sp.]|uniref:hypothetical protein n=1 Tax=Phenylobacterium sp. TaxID=1871053 RepID=UPI003BB5BEFC
MNTPTAKDVADIIGSVGDIVGKTKLQKTVALLELAGLGPGFSFSYYLYGPYSEQLATAVDRGVLLGLIREEERVATWGGKYSVFKADHADLQNAPKEELIRKASRADSIVLELAVTAAFLAANNEQSAWDKLMELKPDKAFGENLGRAKTLYEELRAIQTPTPLPNI